MFLHYTDTSAYVRTLSPIPLTLPSVVLYCDAWDRPFDIMWYCNLAGETCDARPLLYLFRQYRRLLSGHIMLLVSQMPFDLRRPYCISTLLANHNLPFANVLELLGRHGITRDLSALTDTTTSGIVGITLRRRRGIVRPFDRLAFLLIDGDAPSLTIPISFGAKPCWSMRGAFTTSPLWMSMATIQCPRLLR